MFKDYEVYQCFCQYCFTIFEGKTKEEVIKLVTEHEKKCPKKKE